MVCPDPLKFTASVLVKPLSKKVWDTVVTHDINGHQNPESGYFNMYNLKYDEKTETYYTD